MDILGVRIVDFDVWTENPEDDFAVGGRSHFGITRLANHFADRTLRTRWDA